MPKSECPKRFTLAQWQCGDIKGEAAQSLARHVESCPACRAVLSELKKNVASFEPRRHAHLARVLDECRTQAKEGSLAEAAGRFFRLRTLAPALAVAAAVAIGLYIPWSEVKTSEEGIAFKGATAFSITAQRDDSQFSVRDGSLLRAGDSLKMEVTAAEPSYIAVISIEENKKTSAFYPETLSGDPLYIKAAGRHSLPGSIVLDDAQGTEWIVLIVSLQDFDIEKKAQELKSIDNVTRTSIARALEEHHLRFHIVAVEKK